MVHSSSLRMVSLVSTMGALANALFFLSQSMLKSGQVALDLSHIGTVIAAVYGGGLAGFASGLLAGLGPGVIFGPGGGLGFLGLLGLPAGKALTGLTVGVLSGFVKRRISGSSLATIAVVLVGYLPEFFFTVFFFKVMVPIFLPGAASYLLAAMVPILAKAWFEMVLIGLYMGALTGNSGFTSFMERLMPRRLTRHS